MTISFDAVKDFDDYIETYTYEDEEGYDGVHDGGIKGLRSDAPESAVKAYEEYCRMMAEAEEQGIKL